MLAVAPAIAGNVRFADTVAEWTRGDRRCELRHVGAVPRQRQRAPTIVQKGIRYDRGIGRDRAGLPATARAREAAALFAFVEVVLALDEALPV